MDLSIPVFREAPHACPYIPERLCSNMRFVLPQADPFFMDLLLEQGFRHFGDNFFRPACPDCQACVGIRVPISTFRANTSQRRCLKKNSDLVIDSGPVIVDDERLDLLNRFQIARWIDKDWGLIEYTAEQYMSSFSWVGQVTQEVTVRNAEGTLVAVGIVDFAQTTASATYHYHDPLEARRGLGTWLLLKEIDLLQKMRLQYLYLGLWNGECKSLDYKKRYQPFEMLYADLWVAE